MTKNIKVLFIWKIDARLKKHLKNSTKNLLNVNLIFPKDLSEKNLLKISDDADIIIGWRPSAELLKSANKLKLYINPGTGIKHHIKNFREINKSRSKDNKINLINGHGHAYATAQHTVAMLLALMNNIILHHNLMAAGKWRTSDDKDLSDVTIQLRNRKIGLLGYGAINKYVHKFLAGFENEFHILKRNWNKTDTANEEINFAKNKIYKYKEIDLNKFLKSVDILIIAIPHTDKTENLIDSKELKLLSKNSLIVNIARGIIINEKSLYEALKNKKIAGAALDVWYNYNPKKDKAGKEFPYSHPFHKLNNVLLSPHRAASPFDDLKRWDEVIENISRLAKGKKDFLNIVDLKEEY